MSGLSMKYFVLAPTKSDAFGIASRDAMLTFANAIQNTNMELAMDLRKWVEDLDNVDKKELEEAKFDDDLKWWLDLNCVEQLNMRDRYYEGTHVLDLTHRNISYMYLEEQHR